VTGRQDEAYLLGLRLRGRRVVVIGGGAVAARRVPRLLAAERLFSKTEAGGR